MARVYKSVCNEIDRLYIKILDLSEQQIECKVELEKLMHSGYLNIAKARYIMGTKNVSSLQLPTENSTEIKALSTICRKKCKNHYMFKLEIRKPSSPTTELKSPNGNIELTNDSTADSSNPTANVIIADNHFQEIKDDYVDDLDAVHINEYSDPIKLFGVLVPFTLKTAQQFFKDSLFVIVKCATVQSSLLSAVIRHKHLLEIKALVEKAAAERSFNLHSVTDFSPSVTSESTSLEDDDNDQYEVAEESETELGIYFESLGFQEESIEEIFRE